jgi:3-dehydroquinate synthase
MSELLIQTSRGRYPVHVGVGQLRQMMPPHNFTLLDDALDGNTLGAPVDTMLFAASEANKSLAACETVLQAMRAANCDRHSVLIAVGGGVVQDVATLSASIYMRGIAWVYVPTTFMAMADSCIGGKSSINVAGTKNLVGNIYPPQQVIVDLAFTRTLSKTAVASGMAEAVKICFARGPEAFAAFAGLRAAAPELDSEAGVALVSHALRCKQWFIEIDEFDRAERRLLNFGHTFAHALESATGYAIPHGIAVAVGVLAALEHPLAKCGADEALLKAECHAILEPVRGDLARNLEALNRPALITAFVGDKKHTADAFHLILPDSGSLSEVSIARSQAAIDDVIAAVERAKGGLLR